MQSTAPAPAFRPPPGLALALRLTRALLLLLLLLLCSAPARAHLGEHGDTLHLPTQELTQARFTQVTRSEPAPGEPAASRLTLPVSITLPDTWAQRGLSNSGRGVYELQADLPAVEPVLWALRIDRLSPRHELRVNGVLVSGGIGSPAQALMARPLPIWVELPPSVLHAGRNHIELQVDYGLRGGLSSVWIGPAETLRGPASRAELLASDLPRMLNAAGLALALIPLVLWWRRRSERMLGGMGAVLGLACLRDLSYYAADANFLDHQLGDWLFHAMQVFTAIGTAHFALSLAQRDTPRRQAALWGGAAVLLALGGWAASGGWLQSLRAWSYPLLLGVVGLTLTQAWAGLQRQDGAARTTLLGAVVALTVAAGHDYLCWRGLTSILDVYWMPFAVPLALAATASHMIQRLVLALHDVEQLNTHLEQRVAARTRELEAANLARKRFIAAASHDLRQPAAAIGMLVSVLREQIEPPEQRAMIERVDEAVASMEDLLEGLLDLSRLDAATVRPRLEPFALQPLLDAIAAHQTESARRKGLRLRLRATPAVVHSDRLLVEQILRNLVANALRYTDSGGVLVAARARGDSVLLQVWDSGRGVTYDRQGAIFEEFVQLEDGPRHGQGLGLGLGLAIVKRTAELLDHPLQLRSTPQRGSVFSIRLPRVARVQPAPDLKNVQPIAPPR
jgi:signal transduction histidine kinase